MFGRAAAVGCLLVLVGGCTTFAKIENSAQPAEAASPGYSIEGFTGRLNRGDSSFVLAFSGGGTRAAAFSYGVLKELRDTRVATQNGEVRLLDAVDSISSVSGGSFTSAYYGLYGDRIFSDYESEFLRRDVQGDLIHRLVNPFNWFSIGDRTQWAIDYYEDYVFKGATFADLLDAGGPMIVINASDLSAGNGFWFTQEYFDLLCSDISDFPIARAVAASSAVPGVFAPVVLKNFPGCTGETSRLLVNARDQATHRPEMELLLRGLESYSDKQQRPYVHLVDGGITDNLGLRGLSDVAQLAGGVKDYYRRYGRQPPKRIVVIAVDAATEPRYEMNQSNRVPPLSEVMDAMSGVQLHRYNAATLALTEHALKEWSRELSTPERTVETYLILLDFRQMEDPVKRAFLNGIPTSFALSDEQVDALIEAGGELLRQNPVFRKLMADVSPE